MNRIFPTNLLTQIPAQLLAITLFGTAATANERQVFCTAWEDIARAAMTSRQAGVPLNTMLQLVSDETAVGIFSAAYEQPREDTPAGQQNSVDRFVAFVLSECLKS